MSVIGKISGSTDGALAMPAVWEIIKKELSEQLEFSLTNRFDAAKVNICKEAISALVNSTTKSVTLTYSSTSTRMMGIPSNKQELVDAIIASNARLTGANAKIVERKSKEGADADLRLAEARAEFTHIQSGTASGHYGEKLRELIEGGYLRLDRPHRTYMSSYERGVSRDGIARAPFGCSRRIVGPLASEWSPDKKLVLHQHCSWTGGITGASIKYESEEEEGGGGRHLEESSLAYFQDKEITRASLTRL